MFPEEISRYHTDPKASDTASLFNCKGVWLGDAVSVDLIHISLFPPVS
jgi:hypothetical protein